MMTTAERDKMLAGEAYIPSDPQLVTMRANARRLTRLFNQTTETEIERRSELLRELLGHAGERIEIEPPFHCDYGSHITIGDRSFLNFGCVILDVAPVHIGARVLCGPYVQICAARHPVDPTERAQGHEFGSPITIGDDVWIGAGAIVCPGVSIGAGSVIGAGAVVTRNVPPLVLAVGNPCRVVRELKSC